MSLLPVDLHLGCCTMFWLGLVGVLFLALLLLNYLLSPRPRRLSGRHVLITGGSSGIGLALASEAAKQGANLTLVARNQEKLDQAKACVEQHLAHPTKQRVQCVSLDVTAGGDDIVTEALLGATNALGPVYLLVNCAGTAVAAKFEDTSKETFHRMMDLNYFGSVRVTQTLLPQMKAAETDGSVVFVSSQAGLLGVFGYTAYTASKYAVRGFAEALAMEVRPFGIGVTVSFPPDTDTPGFQEEEKGKPEETKLISQAAGLFKPDVVARSILDDALAGKFYSSPGLDGWFLTTLSAGLSDCTPLQLIVQTSLMGVFRLIGWVYAKYFAFLVARCKKKRNSVKKAD